MCDYYKRFFSGLAWLFPAASLRRWHLLPLRSLSKPSASRWRTRKADSMTERPMTDAKGASVGLKPADVAIMNKQIELRMANVITSSHASNYDPKSNRCYVEIVKQWRHGQDFEFEQYVRQLYDGQTNNLLGYVRINRGLKIGAVYDPDYKSLADNNLGFDNANAYMDQKMRRR